MSDMINKEVMLDAFLGPDSPLREEVTSMIHSGWSIGVCTDLKVGDRVAYVQTMFGFPSGSIYIDEVVGIEMADDEEALIVILRDGEEVYTYHEELCLSKRDWTWDDDRS